MRHIVIRRLTGCTIFFRPYGHVVALEKKKNPHYGHDFGQEVAEHKMCFDFLCNVCLKHFLF
jgi:hypothetical protein